MGKERGCRTGAETKELQVAYLLGRWSQGKGESFGRLVELHRSFGPSDPDFWEIVIERLEEMAKWGGVSIVGAVQLVRRLGEETNAAHLEVVLDSLGDGSAFGRALTQMISLHERDKGI